MHFTMKMERDEVGKKQANRFFFSEMDHFGL